MKDHTYPTTVQSIEETLADKKGEAIRVLDVKTLTNEVDYFVIVTANSSTHARALAQAIIRLCKNNSTTCKDEGMREASWILLGCGDIIVHIFRDQTRQHYQLEQLWDKQLK